MADLNQQAPAAITEQPQADLKTEPQSEAGVPDIFVRKERQIRKMQQELARERQEFEAKSKQYETDYVPRSKLKQDPLSVLMEEGITYDQLSEMMLQAPSINDPATKSLYNKIKELETKQTQAERSQQEQVKKQYEAAINQINTQVKLLVDSDPEFESIKSAEAHDAVVELIEQTFQTEGYLMDVATAAKEVENHLVEQAYRMAQLKKVQARLAPKTETPVENKAAPDAKPAIKTLTNAMPSAPAKRTTEKERIARAMAAFNGNKI